MPTSSALEKPQAPSGVNFMSGRTPQKVASNNSHDGSASSSASACLVAGFTNSQTRRVLDGGRPHIGEESATDIAEGVRAARQTVVD